MPDYQKAYRLLRHGRNLLAVQATIGGNNGDATEYRVRLLVDTGSSFTILPVQVLETLGYDTRNPLRRQELVTGQGRIYVPVIKVSWFNCVGQVIENLDVVAHDIPPNIRIDGLVGRDFLTRFQAVISVGHAEIRCQ
ncbi:retropepsin-like domain-containing protein [Tychonema sp. LEGE 07199]|uniref:retropepsin-like aspartic protease family protein n=1 Tax=unclassified Tychonema TaxID=2642144 RepID=UPI00188238AB|nr:MULTISPECIES: retropepsin-like aspartic protease [unclassified Tychonema]MBE9123079.1 retropepsin-like domain-containing protein [Tychonema sp. LEGE 07199]MBE9132785.1 retropepsin-like domain-containing protein [Tychonema sp. LEGE 07196]